LSYIIINVFRGEKGAGKVPAKPHASGNRGVIAAAYLFLVGAVYTSIKHYCQVMFYWTGNPVELFSGEQQWTLSKGNHSGDPRWWL